jgi:hypothetical protein
LGRDIPASSGRTDDLQDPGLIFTMKKDDIPEISFAKSNFFFIVQKELRIKEQISGIFTDLGEIICLQAVMRPLGSAIIWIM